MNQVQHSDLFVNLFQQFVTLIAHMLGSELFWVCIVVLTGLGRWLLLHETVLFVGKKDENLTIIEKRKRMRLLLFGRGLICIGAFFLMIFILLCLLALKY